jgi:hypothetical protein
VFLVLLFPDGRLPSRRWVPFAWLNVVVTVLGAVAVAFSPGRIDGLEPIRNPFGLDSLGTALAGSAVNLVEMLQAIVAMIAVVSPFVRLRHSGFEERQQIKYRFRALCRRHRGRTGRRGHRHPSPPPLQHRRPHELYPRIRGTDCDPGIRVFR